MDKPRISEQDLARIQRTRRLSMSYQQQFGHPPPPPPPQFGAQPLGGNLREYVLRAAGENEFTLGEAASVAAPAVHSLRGVEEVVVVAAQVNPPWPRPGLVRPPSINTHTRRPLVRPPPDLGGRAEKPPRTPISNPRVMKRGGGGGGADTTRGSRRRVPWPTADADADADNEDSELNELLEELEF